jgi:hypothetical protein
MKSAYGARIVQAAIESAFMVHWAPWLLAVRLFLPPVPSGGHRDQKNGIQGGALELSAASLRRFF